MRALAVALLLGGCTAAAPVAVAPDGGVILVADRAIEDPRFAEAVEIAGVEIRRQGDVVEGLVLVRNRTRVTVPFAYRLRWFDDDRRELDPRPPSWVPERVEGRETKWLRGVAPRPDAAGFQLGVRGTASTGASSIRPGTRPGPGRSDQEP